MIGIYKITSPTGKIYIGQSINIQKRFNKYKSALCKKQTRLYYSFIKYGTLNHIFEILLICKKEDLNNKERHYQDLFNCTSDLGLNCTLTKSDEKNKTFIERINVKKTNIIESRKLQGYSLSNNKENTQRLIKLNVLKSVPISVFKNGEFVSSFPSINECSRSINVDKKSISLICKGLKKQAKGYNFKYLK